MAKTDTHGRFSYKGPKETNFFLPLMGDRMFAWALNINSKGSVIPGFADRSLGYVPAQIRLICELKRPADQVACQTRVSGQDDEVK